MSTASMLVQSEEENLAKFTLGSTLLTISGSEPYIDPTCIPSEGSWHGI